MRTRTLIIAVSVIVGIMVSATPALAGGALTDLTIGKYLPEPDDLVMGSVGQDVRNNDYAAQTRMVMVKPGKTARFAILVQNDGTPGTINCATSSFPASTKFKAKLSDDIGGDVTSEWTGATNANVLGSNSGNWYYLNVRVAKTVKPGASRNFDFTCTAAVDLTTDVVRANVMVK